MTVTTVKHLPAGAATTKKLRVSPAAAALAADVSAVIGPTDVETDESSTLFCGFARRRVNVDIPSCGWNAMVGTLKEMNMMNKEASMLELWRSMVGYCCEYFKMLIECGV